MSDEPSDRTGEELLDALGHSFARIVSQAGAGTLLVDTTGHIAWANASASRITGLPEGVLVGTRLDELFHTADRRDLEAAAPDSARASRFHCSVTRPDGSQRIVVLDIWSMDGADGEEAGWFVTIGDRTRRVEAEARNLAAHARYAELFANAPVGLSITTPDGVFIEANDAYHEMLGAEPGWLIGRSIEEVTVPSDVDASLESIRTLVDGEVHTYVLEKRYRRVDGSDVWAELHVSAVRDEDGLVELLIGLVNDITDRRQAELDRLAALEELEERNTDLQNFTAVASHDLKAPLQTIIGFLQTLPRTGSKLDETGERYVERAVDGARRMEKMIDGLLSFARSGTAALDPEDLDLEAVIAGVFGRIGGVLSEAEDAELAITARDVIHADRVALEVVLQNLITNAIRYARGDRSLELHITSVREEGGTTIRVTDNGRGIPEDQHDEVFEMYGRGGTEVTTGSGVGLATCRRVLDRHHGRIWIEPGIDGGTTVGLWFPDAA